MENQYLATKQASKREQSPPKNNKQTSRDTFIVVEGQPRAGGTQVNGCTRAAAKAASDGDCADAPSALAVEVRYRRVTGLGQAGKLGTSVFLHNRGDTQR